MVSPGLARRPGASGWGGPAGEGAVAGGLTGQGWPCLPKG